MLPFYAPPREEAIFIFIVIVIVIVTIVIK